MTNFSPNPQVTNILDRVLEEYPDEFANVEEALKKSTMIKFRDIIYETVVEYNRCGEFVRIFPSKGSKQYEKFFSGVFGTRMLNRLVHKILFTSEVLPYEKLSKMKLGPDGQRQLKIENPPKNLKYDIDDVPKEKTYDQYKNKAAQHRQTSKRDEGGPS